MKRPLLTALILAAATGPAPAEMATHDPAVVAELAAQNPFEVVDRLHHYTHAELESMYPQLPEVLLGSLMFRIVESMKAPSRRPSSPGQPMLIP